MKKNNTWYILLVMVSLAIGASVLTVVTNTWHDRDVSEAITLDIAAYSAALGMPTNSSWNARLSRFYIHTLHDPIIAIPGTDTEALRAAVRALEESQNLYLSYYEPHEQELIRTALHPFTFLRMLPRVEELRREVLAEPSYTNAIRYSDAIDAALRAQQQYVQELEKTFLLLDRSTFTTQFIAGKTSDLHIANTLAYMHAQIQSQRTAAAERKRCLLGWRTAHDCSLTHPTVTNISSSTLPVSANAVVAYGDVIKEYMHTNRERVSLTNTPSVDLPLVHSSNAACPKDSNTVYAFTWRASFASEHTGFWATPVTELIFHNISERKTEFEERLADAGITYEFQPIHPYYCIDSSADTGSIRSAYYIQNSLQENPLFARAQLRTTYPDIALREETVIESRDVLHIATIESYIQALQEYAYHTDIQHTELSPEDIKRLHELITLWRAKSAWLSSEIIRFESMSATSQYVLDIIHIPIEPLFVTRSYFSGLLLANNETLFEQPLSFLSQREDLDFSEIGILEYFTDLQSTIPLHTLVEFIFSQEKAAKTLSE